MIRAVVFLVAIALATVVMSVLLWDRNKSASRVEPLASKDPALVDAQPASAPVELAAPRSSIQPTDSSPSPSPSAAGLGDRPNDAGASTADWSGAYREFSIDQLMARSAELRGELLSLVQPEAERLARLGRAEYLGRGHSYAPEPEDSEFIRNVYLPGAGSDEQIRRVTFPPAEYPEFYAMRAEADWIDGEVARRRGRRP
ncbi:MAG: hypothetical protein JNK02_12205 [Planctomycetes bacterium]|nr:hypothetical protein [Planctomycetota bacterium]